MHRHPQAPDLPTFYPLSPGGVGQMTPPLGWYSHHMVPGPPGPHTTGIPHPAIVNPQVKQEHHHNDNDLMHVKPHHEQRKEQEPKRPHIKKPLNAFMLYMKEMRANVVAECTLKESAAINQILGRRIFASQSGTIILHRNLAFYIAGSAPVHCDARREQSLAQRGFGQRTEPSDRGTLQDPGDKWHALSREEQAKYYELARKERQLHMQLYPGWSARDNYRHAASIPGKFEAHVDVESLFSQGKKKKRKREKLQESTSVASRSVQWNRSNRSDASRSDLEERFLYYFGGDLHRLLYRSRLASRHGSRVQVTSVRRPASRAASNVNRR
ncbi:hypothetical protein AB205_0137990 [Aquarana catesbeiana]|uniref:HMG box domain-containing protein n=1 Tax=Aquarana catesbeiana TaxID=8400 RepID=A0A2G9SBA9_AQUCT|nr:hypothetical protein AB205_0137990 [Aquarana catesbeiana]